MSTNTVRALVAEEQKTSLELLDLEKWIKAQKAGLTRTHLEVKFYYEEEYGGGGMPTETRKSELYHYGITKEELVKIIEARLISRIESKQLRLRAIRNKLKEADEKLGVITL